LILFAWTQCTKQQGLNKSLRGIKRDVRKREMDIKRERVRDGIKRGGQGSAAFH